METKEELKKSLIVTKQLDQSIKVEITCKEQEDILLQQQEQQEWNKLYTIGPKIIIIGGRSGSGKTRVLLAMKD